MLTRLAEALLVLCLVPLGQVDLQNQVQNGLTTAPDALEPLKILFTNCNYTSCSDEPCYALLQGNGSYTEQRERCRLLQSEGDLFEETEEATFKDVIKNMSEVIKGSQGGGVDFWTSAVVCPNKDKWGKSSATLPGWIKDQIKSSVPRNQSCQYISVTDTLSFKASTHALALCSFGTPPIFTTTDGGTTQTTGNSASTSELTSEKYSELTDETGSTVSELKTTYSSDPITVETTITSTSEEYSNQAEITGSLTTPDVETSSKVSYAVTSDGEISSFSNSASTGKNLTDLITVEITVTSTSGTEMSESLTPDANHSSEVSTAVTTVVTLISSDSNNVTTIDAGYNFDRVTYIPSQTTSAISDLSTWSTISDTVTTVMTTGHSNEYCEETLSGGYMFSRTPRGGVAWVDCPKSYSGNITWKCSDESPPRFIPDKPDFGCIPAWLGNLKDRIKNEPPINIASELSQLTGENTLQFGKAIENVLEILDLLSDNFFENNKNDSDYGEKAYNFSSQVLNVTSNVIKPNNEEGWTRMNEDFLTNCFNRVLNVVENIGGKVLCNEAVAEAAGNDGYLLNNIELTTLKVPNQTNMHFSPSAYTKGSITLPPVNFLEDDYCDGDPVALGVFYKSVDHIWKNIKIINSGENGARYFHLNSPVIALSLKSNGSHMLRENTSIVLETPGKERRNEAKCVFWDFQNKKWDESGCTVDKEKSNETHTACLCDHLTNFAVLMTMVEDMPTSVPMSVLSITCSGLSIMALILTIACLRGFRSLRCRRSTITCNLCFNLMMVNFMVLVGLSRTENQYVCRVMAILLHFFLLSAFFWMLVEGYFLYQMIVVVFSKVLNIPMPVFHAVGYGIPFMIVGVSSGVGFQFYRQENFCWISSSKGMVWSFLGPLCFVIIVNSYIFILALKTAMKVRKSKLHKSTNAQQGWLKGSFSTMCLLGVTWILTFTYFDKDHGFTNYIFIILNGSQGVFIFVSHILFNERNRTTVVRFLIRRGSKFGTSQGTSSTRTQRTDRSSFQSGKRPSPTAPDMVQYNPEMRY